MENSIEIADIQNKIYTIRGVQVMLDSDLAAIYGYETKNYNRQVRNNIEKFPDDMMFQLTKDEHERILRCKNFTSSWGGQRILPSVFTEHGIYMLMTIWSLICIFHHLAEKNLKFFISFQSNELLGNFMRFELQCL